MRICSFIPSKQRHVFCVLLETTLRVEAFANYNIMMVRGAIFHPLCPMPVKKINLQLNTYT